MHRTDFLFVFAHVTVLRLLASLYAECVEVGFGGVKMCPYLRFFAPPVSSMLSPSVALIVSVASHNLPASHLNSKQFLQIFLQIVKLLIIFIVD